MNRANFNDISIRFDLSGTGERSLVLLHELGGSLESFDAVIPFLADDFRILRYDQRGVGQSDKPRAAFSFDDHVEDLAALLAETGLRPPYRLIGVAAGAALAVSFALRHPRDVEALILCSPALAIPPERRSYLEERSRLAMREGMRAIVEPALDRSYPVAFRRAGAETYDAYRARFLANDALSYAHGNLALANLDIVRRLGEIACPCLVLAGVDDLLRPPEQVAELVEHIQAARFAIIESGHLMSVQAPRQLAEHAGRFLLGLEAPSARPHSAAANDGALR